MCTNTEERANSASNKDQNTKNQIKYGILNLYINDTPGVNFRIQTNIEFETNKKMNMCFILNILITIVCLIISFITTYKLYAQILEMQNEIMTLKAQIEVFESYTRAQYPAPKPEQSESTGDNHAVTQILSKSEVENRGGNYELILANSRETLLTRLRRSSRRSKEKTSRRKVKSSETLAAHFKGSVPEIFVKDQGLVGPWYLDNTVSRQYKFPKFHLTEGHCSIEVTESALYLIYAQVYYMSSNILNSYSMFVRSEGSSENNIIAKCSAVGPSDSHSSEISCYTATIYNLKANDRIFIQQTEKNRTIILRDGHSFFGLVRLNNSRKNQKM